MISNYNEQLKTYPRHNNLWSFKLQKVKKGNKYMSLSKAIVLIIYVADISI